MMKAFKYSVALLAATFLTVSTAFAAGSNSVDILKYVPADTPYILVSTEPMPDDVAEIFGPITDEMLQGYQTVGRYMIGEHVAEMIEEGADFEEAERVRTISEEFLSFLSLEGLKNAGISGESAFAIYGNGVLPVLRVELSDEALFDAAIGRIEEKAGKSMLVGEAKGESYRYLEGDNARLVVATLDDQAVITTIPTSFDEKQVAELLGISKPRKSLKKSKELRNIGKEYGFSDYMMGFIDNVRLAEIFTHTGTDFDKAVFAAVDADAPELSEVCSEEIMEMVGVAPRIVMGYTELTGDIVDSKLIIEMRSDIASSLATIPAAVPGVGSDPGGFMSFGMGMDILAMRAFVEAQLDAIEADPYECESLMPMMLGTMKAREGLAQPLPPVVNGFKGFFANVVDLECEDAACNSAPTSIDASFLIQVDKAADLMMMASMMDPQIAAMNLMPGSDPVPVDVPQLKMFADSAFAAMSESSVAISMGANAESAVAASLVAESGEPPPFMSMSMDAGRYYKIMADAMSEPPEPPIDGEEMEEPLPEEVRQAWYDIFVSSGNAYDRMQIEAQFTERGLELRGAGILGK